MSQSDIIALVIVAFPVLYVDCVFWFREPANEKDRWENKSDLGKASCIVIGFPLLTAILIGFWPLTVLYVLVHMLSKVFQLMRKPVKTVVTVNIAPIYKQFVPDNSKMLY
jgi:divalent metal cation (Fe/Co/Zn/Cd) transporter